MSTDDKKRPKAPPTKAPRGTGLLGLNLAETISLTMKIANAITLMANLYPARAVSCGAFIAGCELALGRRLNDADDKDIEDAIAALVDMCFDKRDILREDATSLAKAPKGIM